MISSTRTLRAAITVPIVLAALALGPTVAAPAGAATAPATAGLEYVALGDSYAAGIGLEPTTDLPVSGCLQSAVNYPHLVAEHFDLALTDVTCSGAETKHLIDQVQQPGGGTAAVQTDALGADTQLVTVTIGGNDLGFIGLVSSCVALSRTGPIITADAPNCREVLDTDGDTTYDDKIASTVAGTSTTGLTTAFAAIRTKAPNAAVFVVGYPAIMPDAANTPADGCYRATIAGDSLSTFRIENGFPFTDVDVEYIRSVQEKLDAATATAAAAAGFTYVSTLAGSSAHSACQTDGNAYVNGITFQSNAKHEITMPPGSVHPNAAGEEFLAQSVVTAVDTALAEGDDDIPESPALALPGGVVVPAWVLVGGIGVLLLVVALVTLVVIRRRRRAR